jgi:hypothetical protein
MKQASEFVQFGGLFFTSMNDRQFLMEIGRTLDAPFVFYTIPLATHLPHLHCNVRSAVQVWRGGARELRFL